MNTTTDESRAARGALETRCREYTPKALDIAIWMSLRDGAIAVVLVAGPMQESRVVKDLEVIAAVAYHLSLTRVPITLENVLSDASLTTFDTALSRAGVPAGTRGNKRGRLRRLQAASKGLPWRRERRKDGERLDAVAGPDAAGPVYRLLPMDGVAGPRGSGAVQAALDDARGRRRGEDGPELPSGVWAAARRHAASAGVGLTKRGLAAIATYEVLSEEAPAATVISRYGLTRRDLDLALVLAARLPTQPADASAALLRG
jgi:hypothetical protein